MNSRLTKANVEYSNLENVELKRAEVYGTDIKEAKVADKTVVYGRVINSNGDLDPLHKIGTPNYSGRQSSSTSKTSSSSGQKTQTSNQTTSKQRASTTNQQEEEKPIKRSTNAWIK